MEKYKYYVVWEGIAPGIYDSWEECKTQVENYKGAKYKSFNNKEAAIKAFRAGYSEHSGILSQVADVLKKEAAPKVTTKLPYNAESISVDAACSGNPGKMEYRGVYTRTGQEIFRIGPLEEGTNNIGEFLAIVHGLAYLKLHKSDLPIYSDSRNALLWIKQKQCKTQLQRTARNEEIFDLIERAEKWLRLNSYSNRLMKWETKLWGEIPADFGRK